MTRESKKFEADEVRLGHTYVIALAKGILTTAYIMAERVHASGTRFVRFTSPSLRQPGYCEVDRFAECVRAARGE